MAYRMQTSVPELMDLSKEPDRILSCMVLIRENRERMPPIACWRAAWRNATYASSSFTTVAGTSMATFREILSCNVKALTKPQQH
jgi:hypothetical protein